MTKDDGKSLPAGRRQADGPAAARRLASSPAQLCAALVLCLVALAPVLAGGPLGADPAAAQVPGLPPAGSGGAQAGDASAADGGAAQTDAARLLAEAERIAAATGGTVVLVTPEGRLEGPGAGEAGAMAPGAVLTGATALRNALREIFAAIPEMPAGVVAGLRAARGDGSLAWLLTAFALTAVAVAVGSLGYRLFARRAETMLQGFYAGLGFDRAGRVGYLLLHTLVSWLGVGVFFLAANAVVVLAAGERTPARVTAITVISTLGLFLFVRALFVNILAPGDPAHRIVPFGDGLAGRLYRQLFAILAIAAIAFALCIWLADFPVAPVFHQFALITSSIFTGLMLAIFAIVHRREIGEAIRGAGRPPIWRQAIAASWHILAIIYLVAATAFNVTQIALSGAQAGGTILGPTFGLIVGFGMYGMLVILIDRHFRSRQRRLGAGDEEIRAGVVASESPGGLKDVEIVPAAPENGEQVEEVRRIASAARWKGLFEHFAALVAIGAGVMTMLANWGLVTPDDLGGLAERFAGIGVVVLVAYVAYASVKVWIDGKLEEEGPAEEGDTEEGMGPGTSRLATLLPIVRTTLLVIIVSVAAMVVLSALGVNIGPLFAGAGVVGLAVGFGAQTLIRDIFSGAFFLVDDAFRRGEYIEIDNIRGSVERINMRSLQLRHHNGPLHTIPFGEIRQLTNYSRDWVIMKLPLRLTYDTDVENVRKLVKKLGQEMAEEPEIGPMFLQPPKSQGVVEMDDSAMIVRVKFMTKPGDQFILRRHVYQRIQKLFEENGIHFAHREVTVRIADENPPADPQERERRHQAAAGAVRPIIDQVAGE